MTSKISASELLGRREDSFIDGYILALKDHALLLDDVTKDELDVDLITSLRLSYRQHLFDRTGEMYDKIRA